MVKNKTSLSFWNNGVGGVCAEDASAPPKVLICRKSGQNPSKFGRRCFDTSKCDWVKYIWIWLLSFFLVFVDRLAHKRFSAKYAEIRAIFFRTSKHLSVPKPMFQINGFVKILPSLPEKQSPCLKRLFFSDKSVIHWDFAEHFYLLIQ